MKSFARRGSIILLFAACIVSVSRRALAANERGVLLRAAIIYVAPDTTSTKMANMERGMEVVALERSGQWLHVLGVIPPPFGDQAREISGWMLDKGVITASTSNGDQLLFGEAVHCENEASRRGGRKGAAADAQHLYARAAEYFPNSSLAAEAAYRAADIRWQIDEADVASRLSRTGDSRERPQIEEEPMRRVIKKFPHTRWADLAAFHLIENKLCADWQQQSHCPMKEAQLYEKYAAEYPQSPALAEALYDAAWRYAALVEIYPADGQGDKVQQASERAIANAEKVIARNASTDWNTRAQLLIYMVRNHIPVYGNKIE